MNISLDKKHRVLAKQSSHHNHSLLSNPVLYSDSIFSVPPLSPHDQAAQSVYHTSVELGPQTRQCLPIIATRQQCLVISKREREEEEQMIIHSCVVT